MHSSWITSPQVPILDLDVVNNSNPKPFVCGNRHGLLGYLLCDPTNCDKAIRLENGWKDILEYFRKPLRWFGECSSYAALHLFKVRIGSNLIKRPFTVPAR